MSKPIFRRDKPHDHPMTKEGTPLQRYDPIRYSDQGGWSWDTASIKPCDDGEYVKFDDVEAERSALLREVEALRAFVVACSEADLEMSFDEFVKAHGFGRDGIPAKAREILLPTPPEP